MFEINLQTYFKFLRSLSVDPQLVQQNKRVLQLAHQEVKNYLNPSSGLELDLKPIVGTQNVAGGMTEWE